MELKRHHIVVISDRIPRNRLKELALTCHYPEYEYNTELRTRITVLTHSEEDIHDFVFMYQELMDQSYWRIVDLRGHNPEVTSHHPQYEGMRKDFVDMEWEFVIGRVSHPVLQKKLQKWGSDQGQQFSIEVIYQDYGKSEEVAEKLRRRLPQAVNVEAMEEVDFEAKILNRQNLEMARYLNYFYQISYATGRVPIELPEEEVAKAWEEIKDEGMRMANLYNVISIPKKMEVLGHDRKDWGSFYALTSDEIEKLTALEHNRWSVERLMQGMRPCTDEERQEISDDMQKRQQDANYAHANPVSLKRRYKEERRAHYDLCAYTELGEDETGLPVTRYDRDLTAAIPLIVKAYSDKVANTDKCSKENG